MKHTIGSNQYKKELGWPLVKRAVWINIVVILVVMVITALLGALHEAYFIDNLVSPIPKGYVPHIIKVVNAEEFTPFKGTRHPKELWKIWTNESSRGKNTNPDALHNRCKAQGKSNEFGYGGMKLKICFDSFEESVQVVDKWLDKQLDITLCYYNQGIRHEDCNYVK